MIVIKKLCKRYGSLEVIKDLDLEVYEGETLVILGRSGVGKSVLLRLILGIELPDSGSIEIDGKKISEMNQDELVEMRRQMGMLFQSSALFDSLNVKENVAFFLRQHQNNLSEKEISDKVAEALEKVDLKGIESKMPSDLSGGMRKRVALARVTIYRPRILLYDEPTTGLDPITAMQINDMINNIQKELKGTSIVVTHDLPSARKVGNIIAFFDDKKIIHSGSFSDFLQFKDPKAQAFITNAAFTTEKFINV